ncbi:MAG TPA: haloacid dehalogenase type II [Thermomicrobiales bacterium]|jgi:2-haloacid dehalogenase
MDDFRLPGSTVAIRALLFDTFGTIVDWRAGIARDAAPFLARHRIAADPDAFADAWHARYQPAMEAVRTGQRPFALLDTLHRENLEGILREYGADPATIPGAELDELNRAWHRLDPWPDSVPGLTRLRTRFIVAPLSNGNIALLLNTAKRAGLPWDAILGAEVARAYKPQPEAYLRTAAALALIPAECLMVAAHNGDLHAARGVGMATAFIPRPREHGPNQTSDLAASGSWDIVAPDLVTLAEQLGA